MKKTKPHQPVTRNHVAQEAGVSSATVSRVFNNSGSVGPHKENLVLAAAKKLGYVPNKHASALRRSGAGVIMYLEQRQESTFNDSRFYGWFFAENLNSIRTHIDSSMYQLQLVTFSDCADIVRIQSRGLADGFICAGISDTKILDCIKATRIPYVTCTQLNLHGKKYNVSFVDEHAGGAVAARKFLETGHRKPAHITGELHSNIVCKARYEGFCSAFLPIEPVLIDGDLGIAGGYQSAELLLPAIKKGVVDCIFVVNDLTAVGVVQALLFNGIRIPEDASIIAYDNLPFIKTLPVNITTIDLGLCRAYGDATRLLLRELTTHKTESVCNRVAPMLVDGDSVENRKSPSTQS